MADDARSELGDLLHWVADTTSAFYDGLDRRPVFPDASLAELRAALDVPLADDGADPGVVVRDLAAAADRGIVASTGGRYFGFVVGASLPAALAADWLTSAWDQNAGLYAMGPAAAVVEEVAGRWLLDVLGLPAGASFGFVTGAQMANASALAAARHCVLDRAGWDVGTGGLTGAPAIRTVVGARRHGTIDRALRLLGLGAPTDVVAADDQGRMLVDGLALDERPTIVCAQAGEVNTGAFDPIDRVADACAAAPNAWLHVDGAFGLWAAAAPGRRALVAGLERADSWATDAHKWLNVPYDSGIVFCASPEHHRAALGAGGSYLLLGDEHREPLHWTPEHSRRARGFAVYAALRSLGRRGVAELVERCCATARRLAAAVDDLGAELLADVVLNQVLFRFEDDEKTRRVLAEIQACGEIWASGTTWQDRPAIRLSVSSWRTSDDDERRAVAALRLAGRA